MHRRWRRINGNQHMIVYRVNKAITPDMMSLVIDPDGFEHTYSRCLKTTTEDGATNYRQEYASTTKFADLQAQGDFSDYAEFVRCIDHPTQTIRNLGAGKNRLSNVMLH